MACTELREHYLSSGKMQAERWFVCLTAAGLSLAIMILRGKLLLVCCISPGCPLPRVAYTQAILDHL